LDATAGAVDRFRSKRDAWLMALLGLGLAIDALAPAAVVLGGAPAVGLAVAAACLPSAALAASVMIWTDYAIDAGSGRLLVRCGPFRWSEPLGRIEEVRPSRSWASAPALSLDRLEVRGRWSSLLISPADRDWFLDRLAAASPGLERRGDRLVRRAGPGVA
jgi:hypothetical protein